MHTTSPKNRKNGINSPHTVRVRFRYDTLPLFPTKNRNDGQKLSGKRNDYDKNHFKHRASFRSAVVRHGRGETAGHVRQRTDGSRRHRAAVENRGLSAVSRRVRKTRGRSGRGLPAHRTGRADHVCRAGKGGSLPHHHSRNLRKPCGLRQTYRLGTFPEIQAGNAAHDRIAGLSDQLPLNPANRIDNFMQ